MPERPNVLVIMTDQERYPPAYEDAAVERFRRERLPARVRLAERGLSFHRHYVASTACLPSRASLFTGQYPSLHGVRSTDGLAKQSYDPAMTWLDPSTVPTMGDWFRAGGYRTHYRGKWHLSHPDLPGPGRRGLATNDRDGNRLPAAVDAYRRANRLAGFGFDGWIGREPHGPDPADTGFVRDGLFAQEVEELFGAVAGDDGPWLAVASFVNPHDIAFVGAGWSLLGFPDTPAHVPEVPEAPSQSDGFDDRPACHAEFRRVWGEMLYPQPPDAHYRRFYLWLHELVDRAIERILDALDAHGLTDETIVVLTSDHGEMLGAHGGMQQKWHNAFEETLRVPLVLGGPGITRTDAGIDTATSHIDLLPTLLGLVGIDPESAAQRLRADHVEVQSLVGRDLAALAKGRDLAASAVATGGTGTADPVYFVTEDQISVGQRRKSIVTGEPFEAVRGAANVECVVAELDGPDGPRRWKLARYYERAVDDEPGAEVAHEIRFELYDLTDDPQERSNRANDPDAPRSELLGVLERARERCCRRPAVGTS